MENNKLLHLLTAITLLSCSSYAVGRGCGYMMLCSSSAKLKDLCNFKALKKCYSKKLFYFLCLKSVAHRWQELSEVILEFDWKKICPFRDFCIEFVLWSIVSVTARLRAWTKKNKTTCIKSSTEISRRWECTHTKPSTWCSLSLFTWCDKTLSFSCPGQGDTLLPNSCSTALIFSLLPWMTYFTIPLSS